MDLSSEDTNSEKHEYDSQESCDLSEPDESTYKTVQRVSEKDQNSKEIFMQAVFANCNIQKSAKLPNYSPIKLKREQINF